jgi:protein involved in polysaccharide export with SLBB domain
VDRGTVPTIEHRWRQFSVFRLLLAVLACAGGSGCSMLETANTPSTPQSTRLAWLTNWVSQPIDLAPGFDIAELKPAPKPPVVEPQNLLEITVWDLFELGRPYSYPARVSDDFQIDVPMLGNVDVENRTIGQVEATLVDRFRTGEFLLNPRVIVRSLDAPVIKVQVTGAVTRPGYVELTRADRSAYAAILSAGSLSKLAGTQVAITHSTIIESANPASEIPGSRSVETFLPEPDGAPVRLSEYHEEMEAPGEPRAPSQRANTVEEFSVSPGAPRRPGSPGSRGLYCIDLPAKESETSAPEEAGRVSISSRSESESQARRPTTPQLTDRNTKTVWFDVSQGLERDALKAIVLQEGDIVTVKATAQPLRIAGNVNRAGFYPLPPGRSLNVWQAVELAGGLRDEEVPLKISLHRPASEGRSALRWTLSVADYSQHPTASPVVEPGDELHIEPTTGSKIKRVVRNVWSKP